MQSGHQFGVAVLQGEELGLQIHLADGAEQQSVSVVLRDAPAVMAKVCTHACVCVCVSLPLREHLFNPLLLRGQGDVRALAAEQLVLGSVHAHHRRRLQVVHQVLRSTSVKWSPQIKVAQKHTLQDYC